MDFSILPVLGGAAKATVVKLRCRVPHFSRSLREVGLFADTLPTLNQHSVEFSPPTKYSR
jgi:hypothetical protein